MSSIVKQNPDQHVAIVEKEKLVDFLTSMGMANKLSENEKVQFIEIAQAFGLNPFKREIHVSKYGENFSIIIGYETFLKRAEDTQQLDGFDLIVEGTVNQQDWRKSDMRAIITIYRKDRKVPFKWEVDYVEYCQVTKEGRPNRFWATKPKTMIKKVAMAQGFRICFPKEMGGLPYIAEELKDVVIDSNHEVVIDVQESTPSSGDKMPPLTQEQKAQLETKGDASKAVIDDLTEEQKTELNKLLESPFITKDERSKAHKHMVAWSQDRAAKAISYYQEEIKTRQSIAEQQKKEAEAQQKTE